MDIETSGVEQNLHSFYLKETVSLDILDNHLMIVVKSLYCIRSVLVHDSNSLNFLDNLSMRLFYVTGTVYISPIG